MRYILLKQKPNKNKTDQNGQRARINVNIDCFWCITRTRRYKRHYRRLGGFASSWVSEKCLKEMQKMHKCQADNKSVALAASGLREGPPGSFLNKSRGTPRRQWVCNAYFAIFVGLLLIFANAFYEFSAKWFLIRCCQNYSWSQNENV